MPWIEGAVLSCGLIEGTMLSLGLQVNILFPPGMGAVKAAFSGMQEGNGSVQNAVPALSSQAEWCERVDDEVLKAYSCSGTKGEGAQPGVSFNT